ncbi:hypothetical protein TMUPMC115_0142 [Tetragenococcus muriaticus PMC-11-5]|uniref:Uncharacterized protein n=1 Tax=Tetragenococcus muriaticus PMC-11-5 TaxID=1302649 RepID=A0A091C9B8_9ENTE|nr:hypothetical protein TMUPMC115_0142 [Tetragenococcus muriaticus PMC-11-5]
MKKTLLQTPNEKTKQNNQSFTYLSYDSRDLAKYTRFFLQGAPVLTPLLCMMQLVKE